MSDLVRDHGNDLWWNDGNAFRSRLFDAISLLLPSGEQFVIDTAHDWVQASTHPALPMTGLHADVRRFIQEETTHRRAHRMYNARLAAHAPAERLEQGVKAAIRSLADWDLPTRIAMAAAFEHLTALLSIEILRPGTVWLGTGTTPQLKLWRWHCAEEIGHRDVALHIQAAAGVGTGRRVLCLLVAILYLASDLTWLVIGLCRADLAARRISSGRLAAQAAIFSIRSLPSVLRIAYGCVRYRARCVSVR